jgi:hypothetical protein
LEKFQTAVAAADAAKSRVGLSTAHAAKGATNDGNVMARALIHLR